MFWWWKKPRTVNTVTDYLTPLVATDPLVLLTYGTDYQFVDSGGADPAENGETIQRWDNLGTAGNFTQSTAANRPTLATARKSVVFDGTNDLLSLASPTGTTSLTGFTIVALFEPGAVDSTYRNLVCFGTPQTATAPYNGNDIQIRIKTDFIEVSIDDGTTRTSSEFSFDFTDLTSPYLISVVFDGGVAQKLWIDGNLAFSKTTRSSFIPRADWHLGAGNLTTGGVDYSKSELVGIVAWDSDVSDANRQLAENYLMSLVSKTIARVSLPSPGTPSEPFTSGTGYNTYRIPAVTWYDDGTANGVIVAACEGRSSVGDDGDIDIVVRRSTDLGATWDTQRVAAENGSNHARNPVLIADPDNSKVHLVFVRDQGTESEVRAGTYSTTVFYSYSTDSGDTWSTPVEITSSVKETWWRWYATGPGRGIVVQAGANAGRLLISCNHSDEGNGNGGGAYTHGSHYVYSDDGGSTWNHTGLISTGNNESTLTELSGTIVSLHRTTTGARRLGYSTDGGDTWTTPVANPILGGGLNDVQSSLVTQGGRIYACTIDSSSREKLTLRSAATADSDLFVNPVLIDSDAAAYSSMTPLPNGEIGVLWEYGLYPGIRFCRVEL